jgi:hypothetical protein
MSDSSKLTVRLFDGTRQLFTTDVEVLVTIIDGNKQTLIKQFFRGNTLDFEVPFYGNFGDNYSVIAYADGYRQAGFFPVKLSNMYDTTLDVMLVRKDPGFNFANAPWDVACVRYPFLGGDTDPATAKSRYQALQEKELPLACLLNLCEGMSQLHLAQGTPLDYIKQIRWDEPPAQDRFFAFCDPALVDQVRAAAARKLFAPEPNPGLFHPGATLSWKQIQFGEANVQLTFHEGANDRKEVGQTECITVEPDIDYFQDLGAHAIFEVIPNALTHSLTNPVEVYVLRWMAGRQAGAAEFSPLYTLTD